MKTSILRAIGMITLSLAIYAGGSASSIGGRCAVDENSNLSGEDGAMIAFSYNQENDHRLVVIDEKNKQRYEVPMQKPHKAPFWCEGKVYALKVDGTAEPFSLGTNGLVAEKIETITTNLIMFCRYAPSTQRLYLIETQFDKQKNIFHELVAMDFRTRKILWSKRIEASGILDVSFSIATVTNDKMVQVFNAETGEKRSVIKVAKKKS